jgi:hypothetical protein
MSQKCQGFAGVSSSNPNHFTIPEGHFLRHPLYRNGSSPALGSISLLTTNRFLETILGEVTARSVGARYREDLRANGNAMETRKLL